MGGSGIYWFTNTSLYPFNAENRLQCEKTFYGDPAPTMKPTAEPNRTLFPLLAVTLSLLVLGLLTALPAAATAITMTPSQTPAESSAGTAVTSAPPGTEEPTATPERVLIQVVARVANFRSGPGPAYPVITQVPRNNKIELSGVSQDGLWYVFKYARRLAWISADEKITTVLSGDPATLPVYDNPPIPTPRPTRVYVATGPDSPYDPLNCNFNNAMSETAQDALVTQLQNAIDANDWLSAGKIARGLYRCTLDGVFYLLYTQDVAAKQARGAQPMDETSASALFRQGWSGG